MLGGFFDNSSLGTKILLALFFFKEQSKFLILLLLRTAQRQESKCCELKPNTDNQAWMCLCSWRILGVFLGFQRVDPGLSLVAGFELLSCTAFTPGKLLLLAVQHPCLGAALPCCCCAPSARHWGHLRGVPRGGPAVLMCWVWHMHEHHQARGRLAGVGWMGIQPCTDLLFHLLTSSSLQAEGCAEKQHPGVVAAFLVGNSPAMTPFLMPCCSCWDSQVWANCFFFFSLMSYQQA